MMARENAALLVSIQRNAPLIQAAPGAQQGEGACLGRASLEFGPFIDAIVADTRGDRTEVSELICDGVAKNVRWRVNRRRLYRSLLARSTAGRSRRTI
jgi:hypothetical protein